MNFKILLVVIFITGCGLKKPPTPPKDNTLPSIIEKYKKKDKKNVPDNSSGE